MRRSAAWAATSGTGRIRERYGLEAARGNPDTGFDNANFGKVKGAGGNRGVQLGAKVVF